MRAARGATETGNHSVGERNMASGIRAFSPSNRKTTGAGAT
jgi:hypothetical protein